MTDKKMERERGDMGWFARGKGRGRRTYIQRQRPATVNRLVPHDTHERLAVLEKSRLWIFTTLISISSQISKLKTCSKSEDEKGWWG